MAESSTPSFFVEQFLRTWDRDICRASDTAAKRINGTREDAEDFAQETRIRLARVASKPGAGVARYIRKVIANAVKTAAGRVDTTRFDDLDERIEAPQQDERIAEVGAWVTTLPPQLQAIYRYIYVEGLTQREIAQQMGVSQPRIAQLHHQLLTLGQTDLRHLAA